MRPTAAGDLLERYGWAAAAALVLLGFVLRLQGVGVFWLNPDEGIYYSTLTSVAFGEFWTEVAANAHPPAYYLMLRGLGLLTWDFVWLRGPSVLFGSMAVWAFWLVGQELGRGLARESARTPGEGPGRGAVVAGLVAAALLAVNREAITLSQLMRPYMLLLALLGMALVYLLRYRTQPTTRNLRAFVVYAGLAVLTHYSAVLALGVFGCFTLYLRLDGSLSARAWRRLLAAQIVPATLFAGLYAYHMAVVLDSDLMADALAPGGWLSGWIVSSPGDAWQAFLNFQIFHLPPELRARSALLLLGAVAVSLASRDRAVAVLVLAAVGIALLVSALRLYPMGESRHTTWLIVFTLPALGWLGGWITAQRRGVALAAGGIVAAALLAGGPMESVAGARPLVTNARGEQVIRTADVAPLVVERMDPEGTPRRIVMSQQTYNLLMPLYPTARNDTLPSSDSGVTTFRYGSREITVVERWDWAGLNDVRTTLMGLGEAPGAPPSPTDPMLLVAGGWGSGLFSDIVALEETGAVVAWTGVQGPDPSGAPVFRLAAFVLDLDRLAGEGPSSP